MISRRNFIKGGLILGGAVMLDGFVLEPKDIEVQRVDIRIPRLPPAFNGFTICQLTDIHHSPVVGLKYINKVVDKANSLSPDLVALTGDYIDDERKYAAPAIEALARLKARHGVVSILGNHDYFIGESYSREVIRQSRIPLLQNSHIMIRSGGDTLCIAGTRDYLEDKPDARASLKGVPLQVPRVLLSHHPDYSEYLPLDEKVDLVLSGHTHGGQITWFGRSPLRGTHHTRFGYWHGRHHHDGAQKKKANPIFHSMASSFSSRSVKTTYSLYSARMMKRRAR